MTNGWIADWWWRYNRVGGSGSGRDGNYKTYRNNRSYSTGSSASSGGGGGRHNISLCCLIYFLLPVCLKINIFIQTISAANSMEIKLNETFYVPDDNDDELQQVYQQQTQQQQLPYQKLIHHQHQSDKWDIWNLKNSTMTTITEIMMERIESPRPAETTISFTSLRTFNSLPSQQKQSPQYLQTAAESVSSAAITTVVPLKTIATTTTVPTPSLLQLRTTETIISSLYNDDDDNDNNNNNDDNYESNTRKMHIQTLLRNQQQQQLVQQEFPKLQQQQTHITASASASSAKPSFLSSPSLSSGSLLQIQSPPPSSSLSSSPSRTIAIKTFPSATNSTSTTTASLKSHKTDAPMLNYIFDSHLAINKHHHRDRNGPHFVDVNVGGPSGSSTGSNNGNSGGGVGGVRGGETNNLIMNATVQAGSVGYLNCRISLLQDKTVSWVKRGEDDDNLQLLTVGTQTYSGDTRFSVEFQYPNNWRLRISEANKSDEGMYECQISTYPPRVVKTYFHVQSPEVIISDEHGFPLVDKYYEVDSTIQLVCIIRHISMATSIVYWLHGESMLNYDMSRGGISVRSNLMDNGANSTLSIAKLRRSDSGNYTCSIGPNDFYTVTIHVLNGENFAELYHGSSASILINKKIILLKPLQFLLTLLPLIIISKILKIFLL